MIFGKDLGARRADLERWRSAFAYIPVRLTDGRTVWLEWYFKRFSRKDPFGGAGLSQERHWQRVLRLPLNWEAEA